MVSPKLYYNVYMKSKWSDAWGFMQFISPIKSATAVSPAVGTANFIFRYGSGNWEDGTAMIDGSLVTTFRRYYIQLRSTVESDRTNETILFTGWIPAELFRILGDNLASRTCDQIFQAHDLVTLFDTKIETAWVEPRDRVSPPKLIGDMPTFNKKHTSGSGLLGNRSLTKKTINAIDTYVFSWDDYLWSVWDIIEYLLSRHLSESGPTFYINSGALIKDALQKIDGVYDFDGRTLRQALNILLPRNRGFIWYVYVDNVDDAYIYINTILDENITIGAVTIPANDNPVVLSPWTDTNYTQVEVKQDSSLFYDRVVVRGAKMKTCFTVEFDNTNLTAGWSSALEKLYLDAGKNHPDYAALSEKEKMIFNDRYRQDEMFKPVFTHYVIPPEFEWYISYDSGGGPIEYLCNPELDEQADIITATEKENTAAYWNVDKRILTFLPMQEGYDYSTNPPTNLNPTGTEPEFSKPFVLLTDHTEKFVFAEKMTPFSASVRPLQRDFGLEVKTNPAYLLAAGYWSAQNPEPGIYNDFTDAGAFFYTMVATVFVETDQYVECVETITTNPNIENLRTIVIDIPDAELWYIVPYTVIGIDEAGNPLRLHEDSPEFLRDDRELLRNTLASAVAFYGKQRQKVTIVNNDNISPAPLGSIILDTRVASDGEPSSAGSVVTSLVQDYIGRRCTLQTDFSEFDFRQNRVTRGTATAPTMAAATKQIDKNAAGINKLKDEMAKFPLREANTQGLPMRFGVVREIPTGVGDRRFRGNFIDESGKEITSGQGSNIQIRVEIGDWDLVQLGFVFAASWYNGEWWQCGVYYDDSSGDFSSGWLSSGDYSSGFMSSGDFSSGWLSTGDFSSGEWGSSGFMSSGDFSSGEWGSSGFMSSGDFSSGEWGSSGFMSSGDFSSGEWGSSGFMSSGDFSSDEGWSSGSMSSGDWPDLSSDLPSSGEPSSGDPFWLSSGEPSSEEPSSGEPSSGEPSSGEPSSGAVSSGEWYDCPDTLVIEFEGVTNCGSGECGDEDCVASDINGIWALPIT